MIKRVFIIDPNFDAISAGICLDRPDLEILDARNKIKNHGLSDDCALITFSPDRNLNEFEGINWVHCAGAGVDKLFERLNFYVPIVTKTVGSMGSQIAEYVISYTLFFSQKLKERYSFQEDSIWNRNACSPNHISNMRVLIFGVGSIGASVCMGFKNFGAHCTGVSKDKRKSGCFDSTVTFEEFLDLKESSFDVVVAALPLTSETENLIDEPIFKKLTTGLFFNVGRGKTVSVNSLLCALELRRVGKAILDVFIEEPLPSSSSLWQNPNVTITPHVSGLTKPGDIVSDFLFNLRQIEIGDEARYRVFQARGY